MAADGKKNENSFTVCGFDFMSENDAQKAEMDLSKIKVLQTRVKTSRPADLKDAGAQHGGIVSLSGGADLIQVRGRAVEASGHDLGKIFE